MEKKDKFGKMKFLLSTKQSVKMGQLTSEFFAPDRIIALGHPTEWPPRSPDLTPCDYFLWGYLKTKVYRTPPANIDELIQRITDEVNALKADPNLIKRSVRYMVRRVNVCLDRDGRWIEGKCNDPR